jgi:hypothetical protein
MTIEMPIVKFINKPALQRPATVGFHAAKINPGGPFKCLVTEALSITAYTLNYLYHYGANCTGAANSCARILRAEKNIPVYTLDSLTKGGHTHLHCVEKNTISKASWYYFTCTAK